MDVFSLMATIGLDASGFTSGLNAAGDLMKKFAGAVVEFGTDVVNTGMGFDKQMSSVQAVLGKTEGTMENMERLRTFALDQAHDSIFTAEETGKAYYYMGMAGWKTEQMLAGLPGIMNLAAASGEDLSRVSDIVTDSITAFGLSANDVTSYVDILAQTATNANTDVSRMGETFKYVAPIAGALGADVDDVAVSIGIMANAGIKGSMAGTALRNIFTRISTNAGETKKDLGALTIVQDKLGVAFWDSEGKMRDWGTIISETREAWKGLTDEEQVYYAKQIASQRGMSGWLALMNATDEEYQQLTQSINESAGAAQNMADVQLDNLWGDIQMFNASLDVLKVAIYDDVKGPMREVVQDGTDALDRITQAINENGLTGGIEQLGVEIEAAGEKFAPMLESLGTALGPLIDGLFTTVLPKLEEAGLKLGAGLMKGIGEALTSGDNPILGMIGTLIGGAGYGVGGIGDLLSGLGLFTTTGKNGSAVTPDSDFLVPPELKGEKPVEIIVDPTMAPDSVATFGAELGETGTTALTTAISTAGTTGGAEAATNISTALGGTDTSALETALGNSGSGAGSQIVSAIQSALAGGNFHINVGATVTGLPNSGDKDVHAKSMYGGTILRGATMFGINAAGQPMIGGDAGAEAIIGLNSLAQMIHQYVGEGIQDANVAPANTDRTLRDAVYSALQEYGLVESMERMSEAVAAAVARVASKPTVVTVGGRELATATVDYNAMAANSRSRSYARGYGQTTR